MSPHRRAEGGASPTYGARSSYFTIEINHGGFFVGNGSNRAYVDGAKIWYDDVDSVTWSPLMLEKIVEEIGYEMAGRLKVWYCVPMLSIRNNGLREIKDDNDTDTMVSLVGIGHHCFSLYIDHDQSMLFKGWDDVLMNPAGLLPKVISPVKPTREEEPVEEATVIPIQVVYPTTEEQNAEQEEDKAEQEEDKAEHVEDMAEPVGAATRQSKRKTRNSECLDSNNEVSDGDDSDDSDFDCLDSDNEVSDGDNDLNADKIDDEGVAPNSGCANTAASQGQSSNVNGAAKNDVKDEESEGEDLWAPDSDEDENNFRFKTFREVDLHDPKFHVGQVFGSVELLRKAVRAYSCLHRKDIKFPINDKQRVKAVCKNKKKPCTWYLWASLDSRTKSFMVKKYVPEHTCTRKWKVYAFTAKFIADKYLESFRADQDMNLKNFSRVVQKAWNMTPSRSKLQRARRLAMKIIYGDEEKQYTVMWDYANEIRRSNPGSIVFVSLDANGRFKQCYMGLDACKREFLAGCRPVICIDGCHIKTRYGGQLLTAVGMDPNDCIFPIAMASVEVEDTATWTWFLDTLKADLGINNTAPWTIMSDKQKGLINAVRDVFPQSEHRFCVRHMWQNFQQVFKGDVLKNQLWKIARSNTVELFDKHMEQMKALNVDAHAWLHNLDPSTWVKAFQSDLPKCDILLNNNCEVFNKYIVEARELPVLSMFERVKSQLMTRHYTKQKEAATWTSPICPKIKKKLDKNIEWSNNVYADGAGDGLFAVGELVSSVPVEYVVDLKHNTCSCMRWQKTGIPCPHVISCLRHEEIDPITLVDKCYSVEMHIKAYENIVYPCKDRTEWQCMNGPPILPPQYTKHVGRPTKVRRKAPGEIDARGGGKKMSRHGVIMHCNYCGQPDHNIAGCKFLKAGLAPPNAPERDVPPPDVEPTVIPQEQNPAINTAIGRNQDLFVNTLIQERPEQRDMQARPTPDSSFITAAQALVNQPAPSTSTIRQGDLARQLLQMQQDKNRANEERKKAIFEAKYLDDLRKAEEKAKKKLEQEVKKAEVAQVKAREAAERREKKRQDSELNKKARAETKKFVAEVKKACAQKKKLADAEKKAAEKKAKSQALLAQKQADRAAEMEAYRRHQEQNEIVPPQAKKVSMFDELRAPS